MGRSRGFLQVMAAAQKRAERDSARRYRENVKLMKEMDKLAEQDWARRQVAIHEARIDMLVSMHKDCSPPVDWAELHASPQPREPMRKTANEDEARSALDSYRPGWFARLFGLVEKQRSKLVAAIAGAQELDTVAFQDARAAYATQLGEWREARELAGRVLDGDLTAYIEVIEEMNPFAEVSELGSTIEVRCEDTDFVEVTLQVNTERVVPSESKGLLKSGKLSVKPMPTGKFNEIYQDYVCGAVLRVARELFAILPLEAVDVSAVVDAVNPHSRKNERCTILSAQITRTLAAGISFDQVDPSDCIKTFKHCMKFTKSKGFEVIERLPKSSSRLAGRTG